jgi:hypothetical protein
LVNVLGEKNLAVELYVVREGEKRLD